MTGQELADCPQIDMVIWDEETGLLNAVIETAQGSRSKYDFDDETGIFMLKKSLPAGMLFPHNFGFVPRTLAEDGDPLDILVLADEPAFAGCRIPCRLLGVVKGQQIEGHKTTRNDRLIGVAHCSHEFGHLHSAKELPQGFVDELEHFFVAYHDLDDVKYRLLGWSGPKKARSLVKRAAELFRNGK